MRIKNNVKKDTLKISILVFIGITVFSSCDNNDIGGDRNENQLTNGYFGPSVSVSWEQVYNKIEISDDGQNCYYSAYNGNALLVYNNAIDEEGTISESGKLEFIIGTPVNTLSIYDNWVSWFLKHGGWDSVTSSSYDVQSTNLGLSTNVSESNYLDKTVETYTAISDTEYIHTYDNILYTYVDRDVIITAKGKTLNHEDRDNITIQKYSNASLHLKQGWNAIYSKSIRKCFNNNGILNVEDSFSIFIGDSSVVKWVIIDHNR